MRCFLLLPGADAALVDAFERALALSGHEAVNDPRAPPPHPIAQAQRQAFVATVDRMLEADALVADATAPGQDVGWAAAWFLSKGRLVVLACRRDAREGLGMMLAGNPSPWQRLVLFDAPGDLEKSLAQTLSPR